MSVSAAPVPSSARPARPRGWRLLAAGLVLAILGLLAQAALAAPANAALTEVDLAKYKRVGRFDLPFQVPTPPATSLLASEASAALLIAAIISHTIGAFALKYALLKAGFHPPLLPT